MLVLARRNLESVVVEGCGGAGRALKVTILGVRGGKVRLGFEAPADVPIHRWEVWQRVHAEERASRTSAPH